MGTRHLARALARTGMIKAPTCKQSSSYYWLTYSVTSELLYIYRSARHSSISFNYPRFGFGDWEREREGGGAARGGGRRAHIRQ